VLTEDWQTGGVGNELPPEIFEPEEAMANAAVLIAQH
jgi:hypothetical protein